MKHERKLRLNARRMDTKERAHDHLKERLLLPEWYGNNLDALSDCLGAIAEPTRVIVRFAPILEQAMEGYGAKTLDTLRRAAEENPNLRLELRERS